MRGAEQELTTETRFTDQGNGTYKGPGGGGAQYIGNCEWFGLGKARSMRLGCTETWLEKQEESDHDAPLRHIRKVIFVLKEKTLPSPS